MESNSRFEINDQVTARGKGIGIVVMKDYRMPPAGPRLAGLMMDGEAGLRRWFYRVRGGGFDPYEWYAESTLARA